MKPSYVYILEKNGTVLFCSTALKPCYDKLMSISNEIEQKHMDSYVTYTRRVKAGERKFKMAGYSGYYEISIHELHYSKHKKKI